MFPQFFDSEQVADLIVQHVIATQMGPDEFTKDGGEERFSEAARAWLDEEFAVCLESVDRELKQCVENMQIYLMDQLDWERIGYDVIHNQYDGDWVTFPLPMKLPPGSSSDFAVSSDLRITEWGGAVTIKSGGVDVAYLQKRHMQMVTRMPWGAQIRMTDGYLIRLIGETKAAASHIQKELDLA